MAPLVSAVTVAEIGALLGDTARAKMLSALMAGEALTASELAFQAGVTPQTASGHLAKLSELGLLALQRQGRHRYFRLASPLVAQMIEGIMAVASVQGPPRHRGRSRIDDELRLARTCYDHLAGRLGVALADALAAQGRVELSDEGGTVTEEGTRFLAELGVDLAGLARAKRRFCRPCLDWSERRPHIAGALGAGLAQALRPAELEAALRDTRAVAITPKGSDAFRRTFGFELS
jgi:DNA-binding transcriptional ArsR family regulator